LLVHDAIRNYNIRSFSYVDTLAKNFIKNHIFSSPDGVYEGSNLLYKISFTAKRQIIDNIDLKGTIYIQPDDYSIHKLEYSASYSDSEKNHREIFNIETEYGHESAVNSRMCLKYISFNNSFAIPDSGDNKFFKLINVEWKKPGGPYTKLSYGPLIDMTIRAFFNRKIDHKSAARVENYTVTLGTRKAKVNKIEVEGDTILLTLRDDKFSGGEVNSCELNVKNLKDINGNLINKRKELRYRQFRELFVQEYNKPMDFRNDCFIQYVPLELNCLSLSDRSGKFWMNTPLKADEKKEESRDY
jgi:hypothetical protein